MDPDPLNPPADDAPLAGAVFEFAHGVGSPLMVVLTLSELLKEDHGLSPRQRADMVRMHEAARDIHQRVQALRRLVPDSATRGRE
jgi:hypothetical protein